MAGEVLPKLKVYQQHGTFAANEADLPECVSP